MTRSADCHPHPRWIRVARDWCCSRAPPALLPLLLQLARARSRPASRSQARRRARRLAAAHCRRGCACCSRSAWPARCSRRWASTSAATPAARLLAAMLAIKPAETFGLRDARSLRRASRCSRRSPRSCSTRARCRWRWDWSRWCCALVALQRLSDLESGERASTHRRRGNAWRASAAHGRDRPAAGVGGVLAVPAPGLAVVGRARTRAWRARACRTA